MKQSVLHMTGEKQIELKQLSVAECIEVADKVWQVEKNELLNRLDEAKVDGASRLQQLNDHDARRGLASELTRQVFRLKNAMLVLDIASDKENKDSIQELSPSDAVELALRCLGYKEKNGEDESDPT